MSEIKLPWTSDVRVSLPAAVDPDTVLIELGAGFVFTSDGALVVNASPVDIAALQMPMTPADTGEYR